MTRLLCPLFVLAAALWAGPAPEITLRLSPAAPNSAGRIPYLDVTLTLTEPAASGPLFQLPLVVSNVETAAESLEGLTAADAAGPLALPASDDPASAPNPARRWSAARPVSGPLTVRYRVPITNQAASRGAAPPLELRSDSGAFSGSGATFLLLPDGGEAATFQLQWDLSRLPAGSHAVSSLGAGDSTLVGPGIAQRLRSTYFMAGQIQLYPAIPPKSGFFSAWHGKPPMDLARLMASEQKLYAYYEEFFDHRSPAPYGVFLRENPVNAGGGVGLSGSFVATFGPKVSADELTVTLAHEMLHTFVGGLEKPAGLEASWFSEGLAVHYARLLALRSGQITPSQFLADLNSTAGRYYTNAFLGTPNAEIPARFWADTRVRVLPYDRGSLYFAVLDSRLRAASGGKRSLDELLREFLARRKQQLAADESSWVALLARELGPAGPAAHQAMLQGALQLPEPGAFGPQFRRTRKLLRRYELGFAPEVLTEPKRVIRGLIPGSSAAQAGLKNGDEILKPVPQDSIQARQEATLTLEVQRAGQTMTITYLPRGEAVEAYQWELAQDR